MLIGATGPAGIVRERAQEIAPERSGGQDHGLPQPKVSELVSGTAAGFSAERLIRLLNSLGVSVSIALREEPHWKVGSTFVHFGREPNADMVEPEREQSDAEE